MKTINAKIEHHKKLKHNDNKKFIKTEPDNRNRIQAPFEGSDFLTTAECKDQYTNYT